jgi:serine protease Do
MKTIKLLSLFCAGLMASLINASVYAALPAKVTEQASPRFSEVLTNVMPTVVNITVIAEGYISPIQKRMHHKQDDQGAEEAPPSGDTDSLESPRVKQHFEEAGSGVIVGKKEGKGYIVTNAHVVRDAKTITVNLNDGRRFKAKVIGVDRLSDIAVLEITAKDLKTLPFGDSDQLQVGDFVAAVGNPFGLHQTVTSGVVSALHRSDLGIEGYENFIQTDASINPGNSGGALIDLKGNLVGINTALIGPIGGNVGIGLSIPGNTVKQVASQLIKHGKVDRGILGVFVQDLTPALADAFNFSGKKGALITNIIPGSPAEKAKLEVQDVIDRANDVVITNAAQLRNMMGLLPAGTHVNLHVLRKDKAIDVTVAVANPQTLKKTESAAASFLEGVRLTSYDELSPDFGPVKGVGVLDVSETSDAWIGGLRPGDIILTANGEPIANLDELMTRVKGDTKRLLLKVGRGGGIIFLVIDKL